MTAMSWTETVVPNSITKSARVTAVSCTIGGTQHPNLSTGAKAPTVVKGGGIITTYLASTSNQASIIVSDPAVATALTMVLPASGISGTAFAVTGVLTRTDTSAGVVGATIQLQRSLASSGPWVDVTGKVAVTGATGTYSISTTEGVAGTFWYQTKFAGAVL